eukprot:scaffold149197_cov21-Tisochrysis_lutea.AAC.1
MANASTQASPSTWGRDHPVNNGCTLNYLGGSGVSSCVPCQSHDNKCGLARPSLGRERVHGVMLDGVASLLITSCMAVQNKTWVNTHLMHLGGGHVCKMLCNLCTDPVVYGGRENALAPISRLECFVQNQQAGSGIVCPSVLSACMEIKELV